MTARILAALAVLALAAPSRADDAADALKQLQGTWQAIKVVNDGQEGDAESIKDQRLIVKADGSYTLAQPEGEVRGKLEVHPSKSPAHLDASYDDPNGGTGTVEAIYKLEGARLTICWSDPGGSRPDAFRAEAGTARRLIVLERRDSGD